MLRDLRARLRFGPGASVAVLEVEDGVEPGAGAVRTHVKVTLLLDAAGGLVGVDLGGEGMSRTAVMAGRHEDVTKTNEAEVEVEKTAGEVTAVRVPAGLLGKRG